jgi:lactate 2-monooxygenase
MRANREAFYKWRIWPRMLRDVGERDLRTEILGTTLPAPFLLAPIGVLGIAHPDGERAPARAAAATGIPLILSTVSSVPMEEVAAVMGAAPHWFQLYPGTNRDVMSSMVRRAEAAGYSAVVVTLDTTMLGWREVDLQQAYLPFLQGQGLANYFSDPAFRAALPKPPEEDPRSAILYFLSIFVNPRFSWPDIDFLRQQTRLPIVLKGILHPADAALALDHGVDGIIVSNHGGRQVDGATAALDALPLVAEAVAGRGPVLMDSGIRRAADVLKARALGATAVLLGRPYAYALAAAGEAGVRQVIRNLLAELDLELALSGRRSMAEVDRSLLDPLAPETDSRPT